MKPRTCSSLLLLAAWLSSGAVPAAQTGAASAGNGSPSAVIDKYCVTCHSARLATGSLVLEGLDLRERSVAAAALREKIVRKLLGGTMPPAGAPRPASDALAAVRSSLAAINDDEARRSPNPGRTVVHRLNRAEYVNAIRDLLGIEIDGRAFLPADDSSFGFDNVADVLSISPGLLDRYMLAARRISRMAVGDATLRPAPDVYALPISLLQEERMSEDLPFGSRGGISVRHEFPADGEYEFQVTLQRSSLNVAYTIRGLDANSLIQIRLDGALVREVAIDGSALPNDGTEDRPKERAYNEAVESKLRLRLPVKAGPHRLTVTFARHYWYVEGLGVERLPLMSDGYTNSATTTPGSGKVALEVASVQVLGPFNGVAAPQARRDRIFTCWPSDKPQRETPCAKEILSRLARRAYRRPVTADELGLLMDVYARSRAGGGFARGIQDALERVLVSPYLLFRKEAESRLPPGAVAPVGSLDLASRLSFFLWSSIPDEELLDAAAGGQLRNPDVLRRQVARMLRDERSKALVSNFFGQWLFLRNLGSHAPDPTLFPSFDDSLREAFRRETELFLESQLREDQSVLDLFTANYTFVNERLARYYGIPDVYGSHFRRHELPADGPRAGVLGHGSVLTVTSYAHRTSPVLRGKWLLENVLGDPPPPPPANVPPFPDDAAAGAPKSVRARMEVHRRNPVCAACHAKIDPLGFALENFDAVGHFRSIDGGTAVDASGALPDGSTFGGPAEFRRVLRAREEQLLTTLTEKLLTYALGRGLEYYDQPAIRQIVRGTTAEGGRWSVLVAKLVESLPFQMRTSAQ